MLADDTAAAGFVAADLIAQAEHAPGASILVTWHAPLLDAVAAALERQLAGLSRGELARESLEQFGALVLARDADEAVALRQPDRLRSICKSSRDDAEELCRAIDNAGAIFLGPYSPVAVGDYAAGPSHVLPTGGTARCRQRPVGQRFPAPLQRAVVHPRRAWRSMADDVRLLAEREGLTAHAASVDVRLADRNGSAAANRRRRRSGLVH